MVGHAALDHFRGGNGRCYSRSAHHVKRTILTIFQICACMPAITPVLLRIVRGGLSAAKQAEPVPSTGGTNEHVKRNRTFFTKISDQDSSAALSMSTIRSNGSTAQTSSQRTIDIEGIKTDGFGYTVTITTGRGTKVRRRWDIRNKTWHYFPEQEISDVEDEEDARGPRKQSIFSQGSVTRKRSGSGPRTGDSEKRAMEVQTQKTFEVRESFHSQKFERGFDYRNPYKGGRQEEDIEVGMQGSEVAVSDWSIFAGEEVRVGSSRKISVPETGQLRRTPPEMPIPSSPAMPLSAKMRTRGSSYDTQRYTVSQRRSSDSVRPKTGSRKIASSHKGSRSYDNIRMGILPSPSTAHFDHAFRSPSPPMTSVLHPPSPPPLPPAARIRRSTSPAVQPINSSHRWVTSTFLGKQREDASRSGTTSPDSDVDVLTHPNVIVDPHQSSSHSRWKNSSFHSSLRAENGSGRSMAMAVQKRPMQPSFQQEEVHDSDEDFSLPLQRPSPRNSGLALDQSQRPQPRSMPSDHVRRY